MKFLLLLCFTLPIVLSPAFGGELDAEKVKTFILENKQLPIAERRARSMATIETSKGEAIVGEAARDLALVSVARHEAEEVLPILDALAERYQEGTAVYTNAMLGKARLLARLGRGAEAKTIFNRALSNRWSKDTYKSLNEVFAAVGDHEYLAVKAYEVQVGMGWTDEDRKFYEIPNDFLDTFYHLRALALSDSNYSCVQEVLPKLQQNPECEELRQIAVALCLAADSRNDVALAILENEDTRLQSFNFHGRTADERKNVPLYQAAILFFEGIDFDAARKAFREYMDRNTDDRIRVLERGLKITHTMELNQDDLRKIPELTGFLLESEFGTDETIRRELTERRRASLLIMHQLGLSWREDWDGAARVCQEIMKDFYPQTLTGASAAMNWGMYLWQRRHDYDAAEGVFRDILEHAPFDGIVPHVKRLLAKLLARRGEYESALVLLDDTIERIDPAAVGSMQRCRQKALGLREFIQKKMDERGDVPLNKLQNR